MNLSISKISTKWSKVCFQKELLPIHVLPERTYPDPPQLGLVWFQMIQDLIHKCIVLSGCGSVSDSAVSFVTFHSSCLSAGVRVDYLFIAGALASVTATTKFISPCSSTRLEE